MNSRPNPVLANVYRKNVIESCHRGSVVVVNYRGETVLSTGDTDRIIYPRSALKMFQAIPLIESGAADYFQLTDSEIALACASHNAEAIHTRTLRSWLARIGLDLDSLENGPAFPLSETARLELIKAEKSPTRAHQNCSGKHAGMLTLTRYLGVETQGYSEYNHPSQQSWMKALSELINLDITKTEWERDGCGLPAISMPMERLAYGCALFANPESVTQARKEAMQRIIKSIRTHPVMTAGTGRCCTDVIVRTGGKVIVKTGAEAVYAGIIPDLGLGIALKIDDGANRGSEVALGAVLNKLGVLNRKTQSALDLYFQPKIFNSQNQITGRVVPSRIWDTVIPSTKSSSVSSHSR